MVPTNISYDDILDRHGGSGGIPDPNHLTTMVQDLKQLCSLASTRSETCNAGMRALSQRRKEVVEEEREREREQAARLREIEERETLKREAEEDEEARGRKGGKNKKQKKESSRIREERPLNHGAHGLARQDGLDLPLQGKSQNFLISVHQNCSEAVGWRVIGNTELSTGLKCILSESHCCRPSLSSILGNAQTS